MGPARGVDRQYLAIEDHVVPWQLPDQIHDFRNGCRHIVQIARVHAHLGPLAMDLHPSAIELVLETHAAELGDCACEIFRGIG